MKTIIVNTKLVVEFNGSTTYFVNSISGHAYKYFNTEKKAINYFNKLSAQMGA